MATTQVDRLLKLSTPLGKDFLLLDKLSGEEGLSRLFSYELDLLHEETKEGLEPTPVDTDSLLGQKIAIEIAQRDGTSRYFHGICNRFLAGGRDARFSFYRMEMVPQIWLLTKKKQSRIFQHKSIPDILKEVFEGFEVSYELEGSFKPRNFCVQYRESDFDFASRLMEEEGIFYFFQHTKTTHTMVLGNTPKSHKDCPTKSEIPYALHVEGEEFVAAIDAWNVDYRLQSGRVEFWDHHFQLTNRKLDAQQPSLFNILRSHDLEIYDFPGGYARKYDDIDRTGGERPDVQNISEDSETTVKVAMESLDAQHKTVAAASDCSSLTAGYRFKLINHPCRAYNGQYVITHVTHTADQNPPYISGDQSAGEDAYANTFTCIAFGSGAAPFRPPIITEKPRVEGTQTATVVGPAGEEIFTDKYGRVKVQFHWDRTLRCDPDSSCWVRVAKDLAGNKWGTMYIPRIGQEVIVDFLEGNPDQPIIVGSVYNPETMPHYDLPKYKTLTYIKTHTSPGGKGYNELRFEDKAKKEQVFIRSQKRMDVRVRGSLYETCGGNRQEVIGVRSDNEPGGNLAITVGGNYDLHVKGDQFIGIDGALYEGVKGNVAEEYKGKQQTVVSGKCELNAQEITLEAMTKISLKVGGSFVTIDLSGVTISGPMVKINSGGAAAGTGPMSMADPLDAELSDNGEPGYLDRPRRGGGGGRRWRTVTGQHAPPFTTRTLPDGSIQCGNGIVIRPSATDPNFQNKVLRDMTTMSNHPTGMNTLNSLNNSGQTTTINHTTVNGGNSYTPDNVGNAMPAGTSGNFAGIGPTNGTGTGSGGSINYNPDFEPPTSGNPAINRPADVGLNHEMTHADNAAHGNYDITTPDPSQPNNPHQEESNTIARDNAYRTERGIPTRADHTVL